MGDLISRSRLKEELKSWAWIITKPKYYHREDADFVIDSQAAVDAVEVVHGRWKVEKNEMHTNCTCSACHMNFNYFNKGQLQIDKMPYCPNCGAKMDAKNENP